ncbi:MAG: extracellular solute-binding protein, partial [Solirubrobacterales bacterium]
MRSPWSRAALGVLGLLALVATGCTASGNGEPTLTLRVLAATSLTEAMREFAAGYERRHPGVRVRLSFAGSDRLAGQIRQGARVDAYAAAEQRLPHELAREGLVETPQAFAANTLVIAHRRGGTAIDGLRSLARPGVGVGLAGGKGATSQQQRPKGGNPPPPHKPKAPATTT